MQKQKINFFLILQATYEDYQVALFNESKLLGSCKGDKRFSSRDLIQDCNILFIQNGITINDLAALIVNQGPAPFTSLRVLLATVNGLHTATNIPLLGIDGLKAFMQEYQNPQWPYTVALFNAFNNDAYYALITPETTEFGYKNCEQLLHELQTCYSTITLRFIGAGVETFKEEIFKTFGSNVYIPAPLPDYCSLQFLAKLGNQLLDENKTGAKQLFPLYLKQPTYKMSMRE